MSKASYLFAASLLATILFGIGASSKSTAPVKTLETFSFVSMGDAQGAAANFTTTLNQVASLHPDFVIFNGDLENDGAAIAELNPMATALINAGLYGQTFLVRGNHDNHQAGSASLWEGFFASANRPLPAGVSNYVAIDSNSTYLTYSFDYGNSRFIGLDVPGQAELLTSAQYDFIDQRLTEAESLGLLHAFIYFHGPEYCVESNHCTCIAKNDGSCTEADFIALINKHPIVSATFHGHEHILGWVHMDGARISNLAYSYEEFFTSPSGGETSNDFLYPARMDYTYMEMGFSQGFTAVTVNGYSFTFSIYKNGTTAPVWSRTFTDFPISSMNNIYLPLVAK
jgi:hypothetical protein